MFFGYNLHGLHSLITMLIVSKFDIGYKHPVTSSLSDEKISLGKILCY